MFIIDLDIGLIVTPWHILCSSVGITQDSI
jgi:hypothetical protein